MKTSDLSPSGKTNDWLANERHRNWCTDKWHTQGEHKIKQAGKEKQQQQSKIQIHLNTNNENII